MSRCFWKTGLWSVPPLLLCLAGALLLPIGCGKNKDKDREVEDRGKPEEPLGPPLFTDVTAQSGVKFLYSNGEEANHLAIVESLGGGVGLIDFDGDGLLDLFLPAGGDFSKKVPRPTDPRDKREESKGTQVLGRPCKLFKNMGNFTFQDVSDQVIKYKGAWPFCHGAAICDYDCDGYPDVLVTGYGKVILFHNEADPNDPSKRILVDVTEQAGLKTGGWSSSAAWGDLDGDGLPDLFIAYYTDWGFDNHPICTYDGKTPDVCPPKMFKGVSDRVYRNLGNGKFADVSQDCGLAPAGSNSDKGLGVVMADLNLDGRPEVYVANDTVDNYLYFNLSKPGTIKLFEHGTDAGVARDHKGAENGSMGVDIGDPFGNGLPAIFVTNYEAEVHALYANNWKPGTKPERHYFTHRSLDTGIAAIGQTYVGWGTGFVDLDHHGAEDLLIINGHVIRFPTSRGVTKPQKPVLLRNDGKGNFKEVTRQGGDFFQGKYHARGVALGDLNNDGKVDFVVSIMNSNVAIVRNIARNDNHWLGIELKGKPKGKGHLDVVGARMSLDAAGKTQWRFTKGGGSYGSTRDPRHVFGLSTDNKPGKLTVYWPDGTTQDFTGLQADRYYRIVQGEAQAREVDKR